MFKILLLVVMLAILVSLASGMFFLVRDRGRSDRTVRALTVRVALSMLLLALLALGFIAKLITPGG